MAMSGVKLTEGCLTTYQDIQKSKKHRYAVFIIREGQIDVETVSFLCSYMTEIFKAERGSTLSLTKLLHHSSLLVLKIDKFYF